MFHWAMTPDDGEAFVPDGRSAIWPLVRAKLSGPLTLSWL